MRRRRSSLERDRAVGTEGEREIGVFLRDTLVRMSQMVENGIRFLGTSCQQSQIRSWEGRETCNAAGETRPSPHSHLESLWYVSRGDVLSAAPPHLVDHHGDGQRIARGVEGGKGIAPSQQLIEHGPAGGGASEV